MDFWSMAKDAFQKAYLSGIKKKLIIVGIGALVFIILVAILVCVILDIDENSSNTDESMKTFGKDYVVNTSISEADIIITDETLLKEAINSLNFGVQEKNNILTCIPAYLEMQEKYKVNAVFAMAVAHCESNTGTSWGYIDSSTNNMFSITGPGFTDENGTEWRTYSSLADSITSEDRGFGDYIANHSSLYFTVEEYTVSAIGSHYCPDNPKTNDKNECQDWINAVISTMTNIFEACGIDTSKYDISVTGNAIVDKAAELYMIMYQEEYGYNQSYHSSTPPISSQDYCSDSYTEQHGSQGTSGRHTKLTDCSGFVNWVLYELEIGKFTFSTAEWINFDPSAYRIG